VNSGIDGKLEESEWLILEAEETHKHSFQIIFIISHHLLLRQSQSPLPPALSFSLLPQALPSIPLLRQIHHLTLTIKSHIHFIYTRIFISSAFRSFSAPLLLSMRW